jgi:hypothetical protein
MFRNPVGKKQAGSIRLSRSKILSQRRQWTFPVIENQHHAFENNQSKSNGCLRRVSIRDPAEKNVKNARAQEKENQGMSKFDDEKDHGERIAECDHSQTGV